MEKSNGSDARERPETQPRLDDETALRLAINSLRSERSGGTERLLAQTVADLMGDKVRYRNFHELLKSCLEIEARPQGAVDVVIQHGEERLIKHDHRQALSDMIGQVLRDYDPDKPWSGVDLPDAVEMFHQMTDGRYRGMPLSEEMMNDMIDREQERREGETE